VGDLAILVQSPARSIRSGSSVRVSSGVNQLRGLSCFLSGALLLASSSQACDLRVSEAWIRDPIPGATALAGYAQLFNSGSVPVVVDTVRSAAFTRVEMHESVQDNGVMRMRPLATLSLPPHSTVRFAPDGKHFMLIGPTHTLQRGETVSIDFIDARRCVTTAKFNIGAATANAAAPAMNMSSMK
jgi:copper(I)-binding protein